jgi:oxygen-dependent protoporphyrinogen oxidase
MTKPHYIILGAGISGLSLAWFLQKKHGDSIRLTLIEKEPSTGGYIRTIQQDGFLFEQGPRGCRTAGHGIDTLQLIEDLGLQNEVISANPSAKKKYRWHKQSLQQLPSGLFSLLCSPFLTKFASALYHDLKAPKSDEEDETIYSFISRRCGKEIAKTLFDPLTTGIYAGDIKKLSIKSCFPKLHHWEQSYGSLLKGAIRTKTQKPTGSAFIQQFPCGLFSLEQGMQQLTDALEKQFHGELHLNCHATQLSFDSNNPGITIHLNTHQTLHADKLFSTLPAPQLASLIAKHHPTVSNELESIHHTTVAIVNLGYRQQVNQWEGFGYLIPSMEKEDNMGVVWDSSVFPQQNHLSEETRLTVMLGGEHRPDLANATKDHLLEMTLQSIQKQMKIHQRPDSIAIQVCHKAIPQFTVGHAKKIEMIEREIGSLFDNRLILSGSWLSGVAINDCIAFAKKITG